MRIHEGVRWDVVYRVQETRVARKERKKERNGAYTGMLCIARVRIGLDLGLLRKRNE